MDVAALLVEIYSRIPPLGHDAVDRLDPTVLTKRPAPSANPIGWLVWHSARVQDHHVSALMDREQIWVGGAWAARFGLGPDSQNTGYGHGSDDVDAVRPESAAALTDYLDEVTARTSAMLEGLDAAALDQIVDRRWDPPVTRGVRLVSVADDSLQHLGQAAYVRGLLRV
jgi:hypothetical protein